MIYAQAGHGRRANLYTDFTFAVWNDNELVPFTKAYSGLTDKEFREITAWVRKNTRERFGPVRVRDAGTCVRDCIRGYSPEPAPQIRRRASLPADAALAEG